MNNQPTKPSGDIPCAVGILTLNSEEGLPACLESVKRFAEIVVCDGNSTDRTLEIARSYGATITKQYDSDEPNLRCEKDKANARQRNMDAAKSDWYFFMDSDDTLAPEVVEEIKAIVEDPNPKHHVYRMPCTVFIAGKEVRYGAAYPAYQTRLVHTSVVHPTFRGAVHERLTFDPSFTVGTLKSHYQFHWSDDRYNNFWAYYKKYAGWELETLPKRSFLNFMQWGVVWRLKTIVSYLVWRIPTLYILHGFKESMPPRIEFITVYYHVYMLCGEVRKYILNDYVRY